ncbi:TPA: GTP cyclohydrolase I FolE [Clostridioides difficile]|uniref:GTP cyclohydrolase I FolE n=4 Tax=Clostridioides difficile TaxID=1496 RepID=UPI0018E935B1|nr:GTP cyclohydrolase I FolE [Clostridioides difficile]EJA6850498.1 GTP cyclohydrolase I FolE [Clostridioides difficile]ELX4591758.1 GTP cyclohydrolase I FolE [Clostridioides difficile]MCJ1733611.1 GTP cyclohydrolase I FolE [Clostridioides difficile]MCK1920687.1 GTP cyclohydrolase I FolE [Clostridioides difficile]MCM3844167.1 GTP cyclohydrolase I FolE [Clostridioides difficile]
MVMEKLYFNLIKSLNEDPNREGLKKTPIRATNAMRFLTNGYNQSLEEIVNGAVFESNSKNIIIINNIEFYSLCEHHILPFYGICSVAYIPNGKIIGLSKIPRIIDMFSRRLQIQERLTNEIAQAIYSVTDAEGVIVIMKASHLCMMMRGVQKQGSMTITKSIIGNISQDNIKDFYNLSR